MLIYNAFTKLNIIEFANDVLIQSSSKIRVADIEKVEGDIAVAITTRGAKLALIMCSLSTVSVMTFRSINKIKNKHKRWTYLFNGQAGVNLEPIVFTGESGKRFFASAKDVFAVFHKHYSNIKDETEHSNQVHKRVSWEAKGNHTIQNIILGSFKLVVGDIALCEAFDFNRVEQDEVAVLFSIDTATGNIVDKWVGELNLSDMAKTVSNDKQYFLTKVDVINNDKKIKVAMAHVVWEHLGNIPTDEEGELLDQDFLHYSAGDDVHDVWDWVEACFEVSIGNDILYRGQRGSD